MCQSTKYLQSIPFKNAIQFSSFKTSKEKKTRQDKQFHRLIPFSLYSIFITVASTPENILNKTDSIALRDLKSTEATSSSGNVQTEAQSRNGQIGGELSNNNKKFPL